MGSPGRNDPARMAGLVVPPSRRPPATSSPDDDVQQLARVAGSAVMADARAAFVEDDQVPHGLVRQPILASWKRSLQLKVAPNKLDLPGVAVDRSGSMLEAARPVIDDLAARMSIEPISVILCDDSGVVLERRTGESGLEQHLDRVWLAPGFSYAERYVGTNGIGTALERGGPAHVFGHEHWVDSLGDLVCAGAPIRHPMTGRVVGVLDLTCWRRDANPLMIATADMIARFVEQALREQAGRREILLLNEYLAACRRLHGPVLAVGDDVLMLNDRARELLDTADQAALVAAGTEALAGMRRTHLHVDLPSGVTARILARPTWVGETSGAGVLIVQLLEDAAPPRRRPREAPAAAAVGSGTAWSICSQSVDRSFLAGEWLVLTGEPGCGKQSLARATHQARTPAAHLRHLDAREFGPTWVSEVAEEFELDAGGTLILSHVDELPPGAASELAEVLEPVRESTDVERRPWVVMTAARVEPDSATAELVAVVPRTVEVPPLRHHPEDVPVLVRHVLARLSHGELTCSPEALRVLSRYRWPGNVTQLQDVMRRVLARRRSGVIGLPDLPAEVSTTTRRLLTPLEAIECDAIVNALREADGNRTQAARLLGVSRATMYRKVREYGIVTPGGRGGR